MKKIYIVSSATKFVDEGIEVDTETFNTIGDASAYISGQWLRELSGEDGLVIVPKKSEGVHYKAINLGSGQVVGECDCGEAWVSLPGEYAWDGCWKIKEVRA